MQRKQSQNITKTKATPGNTRKTEGRGYDKVDPRTAYEVRAGRVKVRINTLDLDYLKFSKDQPKMFLKTVSEPGETIISSGRGRTLRVCSTVRRDP